MNGSIAMEGRHVTPIQVLLSMFGISAFGGLAALLHSGQPISSRTFVATASYSGMIGFSVGALMLDQYVKNPVPLFGLAALLGLSGVKAIDILLFAWKKLGITITASGQKDGDQ